MRWSAPRSWCSWTARTGRTYEAVVSLTEGRVLSWEHVPGAQPAIVLDEFVECEAAVRADPRWQEAMRRRGVTDFGLTMVDSWSAGNFGFAERRGPPARAGADVGAPPSRRQRLRAARRQRPDGRGPERDAGGHGRGRRRRGAAAGGRQLLARRRRARAPVSSRSRSASPRARASSSVATSSPGRSGGCGSGSRPARGW